MDLSVKSFSNIPDYLIASTAEIVTAIKSAGETLVRGAAVTLSGGVLKAVTAEGGTDGLYGIVAEDTETGKDTVVYLSGEFFSGALVLGEGVTAETLEIPFRNIGIYLV